MPWTRLSVVGMGCRACVREMSAHIRDVDGVESLQVDLERSTITVEGRFTRADLEAALARADLPAQVVAWRDT